MQLGDTKIIKSFTLDSDVKYNAFYLYTFSDDKGKEYLFLIIVPIRFFMILKTSEFLFKLNLYAEGPNGIIQPTGFYIKDFDNIYISSYAYSIDKG